MRVAFVIPGVAGGGVRSVTRIAEGLAGRGHEVMVLFRRQTKSLRDRARDWYLGARYGRRQSWLSGFPGVARCYDRLTGDVVGAQDVVVGVGVSCVLEIAELPAWCGVKVHNCRGVEPWVGEAMDRAWSLSMPRIVIAAHLERLMREQGSADPIHIASNGVDRKSYFASVPEAERLGLGTVFHGGAVKDPDLLLDVLNRVVEARPSTPVHVFGSYPRPSRLPHGARYVRFPTTAQARDCYSRCRVWFVGSRNEGLPNPLLEAMACGCAVVSTACGGPNDVLDNGRGGILVPVGDATAMTDAILKLLDDDALRASYVRTAQGIVDRHTWPGAVETFEAALKAIVAGAPKRVATPSRELAAIR